MDVKRREVLPMRDYQQFLDEAKDEFIKRLEMKSNPDLSILDFECKRTLGKGAFGRVLLAKYIVDGKICALKVLEKSQIVKTKQVRHVINEKRILQSLNHPFTVHLEYAFHDNSYVYLGLPFIAGGEMFCHLRNRRKFEEPLSRFYAAQVLLALEYLHYCDMIFRDLKPENLLIDINGYVKITDFGFCKVIKGRTYTMCGTPEYLAPEVILSKGYGKSVDWWAFGVLLFEMASGYPPFHANDPMKIYEKAISEDFTIPRFFSNELENLISHLVLKDLSKRFGNLRGGVNDIKNHAWFQTINWISLFNGKVEAPFVPALKSADDATYFDKYQETPLEITRKNPYGNLFEDF